MSLFLVVIYTSCMCQFYQPRLSDVATRSIHPSERFQKVHQSMKDLCKGCFGDEVHNGKSQQLPIHVKVEHRGNIKRKMRCTQGKPDIIFFFFTPTACSKFSSGCKILCCILWTSLSLWSSLSSWELMSHTAEISSRAGLKSCRMCLILSESSNTSCGSGFRMKVITDMQTVWSILSLRVTDKGWTGQ